MEQLMNHFEVMSAVNVNDKTEKKGNLTYLSWAWAWGELMKRYPDSTSTVYENNLGWNYHTDGKTAWVKCGVTVQGQEVIEYLPVMDNRNNSIPVERITSRNVNDAIQRCITKAIARHGLGLYIYAGEDLPEEDKPAAVICEDCGKPITDVVINGTTYPAEFTRQTAQRRHGKNLCATCLTARKANGNESDSA